MALVPTEPEHEVDDGQGRGARARAVRASQRAPLAGTANPVGPV